MDSASVNTPASTKETTNYARLCQLLVDVGSQTLRGTFDKIHPPARLHDTLSSHPVQASLELLYKGKHKILTPTQWGKLYPSTHSSVSSRNFDITLLMVLLKNFSGLNPPATGWNNPPPATDMSTEADITRLRFFRNEVYGHGSKASVDDLTFDGYWQDIQQTLIRLGGERYGPYIEELKVDCMDPDIGLHYQELVKQWIEDEGKIDQIEGNLDCLYEKTVDISFLEPSVDFKSMPKHGTARAALRTVIKSLQFWRKPKGRFSARAAAACETKEIPLNKEVDSREVCAKNGVDRITSERFQTEETRRVTETVVALLDEAINFHQSDHIVDARKKLQRVLQIVMDVGDRFFNIPTKDGFRVLSRGKELFLEDSVSCSVKHGTLLLDSINSEKQFYSGLLNVIGALAVVISEFKIAKETFSLLIDFHQQSAVTSRERDLGAAYNNAGCLSLILGDLKQAEYDFKTSLKHLESAKKRHQLHITLLETMFIVVYSNIGQLHFLSKNYSKALEKQEQLVKTCKTKKVVQELPFQVAFTVMNNLLVLYTTLGIFSKAEQELKWMISCCYKMKREDCDFHLNFLSLHLSEVLLLHGKPKEAEKAFRLETDDIDLVEMFGGLHINVQIETVEKLVDVFVLKGKIRFACELLETGINILKNTFGPDHFNVASLLYKQGTILTLIGEVSSASEKLKCSVEILEEIFGIKNPLLLKCYMSLGELALRSKRADESYFYFQRAMENIEAIYQVSFVSQLSKKYLEMTMSSNTFQRSKMLEDKCKIEGLVAEHGLVLAVLLSRPVVQDDILPLRRSKTKLKQPLSTNNRDEQCPDSREIISFKYTSDFLQTGQTFLRQGMRKEAAAFFQQARKYCTALDTTRGPAYACIARLYDVLTKKRLENRETLENKHEMTNCLEELTEVSAKISTESSSNITNEDTAMLTFDNHLNLQLVLIFLILLSIELKMIDTTFAAYDLYCRISQNDDGFLHFLNGGVQVYASKTSITCNGKTALQDFLVSSMAGWKEIDSQWPLPEEQLFRSLACKKNVPTDRFLLTYTSSFFLDIDVLQVMDRNISMSVQECFQQKCFKTGIEDSATQVAVDLTSHHHNVLVTGSRIQLLSLCLLQVGTSERPDEGNISEISTTMRQKTVRLTFEDEHTSYFMFSKSALYLLQQRNSFKVSTLSAQHHYLSLTVTHPVKARLTLWRKNRSVNQKVQFVQTSTRHGMADWTVPRQRCSGGLVGHFGVAERFFWPAIDHLANAYHVSCKTDVVYSDEHPGALDMYCEQNGNLLDGQQPKERYTQISTQKTEQSETLRNNLNASILEGLTVVSELSSQLLGDAIQEGDDDILLDAHRVDIRRLPTSSQSQLEQEITPSDCHFQHLTLNPEADIQGRNLTCETPNLAADEATPWTREAYPMTREEDDDNLLGRSLFEKDRNSRRSLIVELHHEITRKSNLMNEQDGHSDEVTQQVGNTVIDPKNAGTRHPASSHIHLTSTEVTNSSFEKATTNPEAELRTPNLMEPQPHYYGKPGAKDDENALGRHLLEKDRESKGASIAKLKGPKIEEILTKWNDRTHADKDFAEDQGFEENQQFESSSVPGQSTRMAKDEEKERIIDIDMDDLITKNGTENAMSDNPCQSKTLSSARGQTQDVRRQTKYTVVEAKKDETSSPVETEKEYILQERDDDTVPDGPLIGTPNRSHNNSIYSMSSRNTDVVDGPLKRPGNNLQIQSGILSENAVGMWTSRRHFVDETYYEELQSGSRRNENLTTFQQNGKETSFRNRQLAFLGGDVLVDGGTTDSLRKEEEVVDGPVLTGEAFTTCQDGTQGICENEMASFPLDTARDVVDGAVHSPKIDANLNDPPGFGGARPKEISRNAIRRNSTAKTKISEPISTYQYNETGEFGLEPGFLARHTVKSNGAILDLPPEDGWDEPYFSTRACNNMTYGDNLRLPGEGINPPGYTSSYSSPGLYAQEAFAAGTSTRGNAQSLAIHQKPSLNQTESWHFPPLESTVLQSNFNIDQGLCVRQQNVCQSGNSIISNVKALFSNRGSGSAYDEMDSMANEYYNSVGNFDNRLVQSYTVRDGHHSSTEDSTSSLLGSLQQIMAKTVNLIASSGTVAKQPKKEQKAAVKFSIQEQARGSREQEQAVRIGVEDSRNQEESTQDNEETERQPIPTPVQETPRPVCSHYQRRCLVRFPCCGKFYPCHRCHNESKDCSDDQARATNATHIRCTICYHEQVIDEQSQNCGGCKSKMSEYFCATCKHFTSVDKNPFHCDKCGICRIHRDRSFHCDVCNVCLDKRLQGKHKCRPDSGHDECCICLEDAFSGCQILPCSHKVHRDCAIAMIQNGVRTCPICRHPLFSQLQNSPQ